MQELHLHLDYAHEGDFKSLEKHPQQVRETYCFCFINELVIGRVLYIQQLIRASLFYME